MIAAIIQARMGSSRLPGKVMRKICDKTLLELMAERISNAKTLERIIVATSTNKKDDVINELCKEKGIECFRGSEEDVLSRYKHAADKIGADVIVRLTSDNVVSDPLVIDRVVTAFIKNDYDFVSNFYPYPRTFPEGFTVEVFSKKILDEGFFETHKPSDREHVTFFMWMQPKKYRIYRVDDEKDLSKYRLTIDYEEDFLVTKALFESLYPKNRFFTMEDAINWLEEHPEIKNINSSIRSNQGWKNAIELDKIKGFKAYDFNEYV